MADESIQPAANEAEQVPQAPNGKPTMAVKVYAPFNVYFEGDAYSVSAVNDVGPFDILPRHHNFLCMLAPCLLSVETPKGRQTVKIHRALMHVKADRVVVFVDV
jgi:F0F1-type ATP synthase epsilon subunit